jgi:uncharacterized iron-regulated protein
MASMKWSLISSALLVLLAVTCTYAKDQPMVVDTRMEAPSPETFTVSKEDALDVLAGADIVYLGEHHDSAADHAAQLSIVRSLYARDPNLAIGLEMFQQPFQADIDAYLAGTITEEEFLANTEYEQRWGFPWEYYAPIFHFAKEHQIPVIALNAPAEVVRKVAAQGLESLTPEEQAAIPPIAELDVSNQDYRDFVLAAFQGHGSHSGMNFENFFTAQVVWDETMAAAIAQFKQQNPDTQMLVLAGQGHVIYGYGIPNRVTRRLGDSITQTLVLFNASEVAAVNGVEPADIVWFSD